MKGFGERLKKLRRIKDVSQSDVAKYLGVGSSAVSKYELYDDSYPSIDALIKISEYFNVSIDYLLTGVARPYPVENNGAIVGVNSGNVVVNNKSLSPEEIELINIYENLSGRERLELLNTAVKMENKKKD